jgi:two-component system sensor histidine kinase BaeS
VLRSITLKLLLAFLTVSLVSTALVVVFARYNTVREFQQFTQSNNRSSALDALQDYYATQGSWEGIANAHFYWPVPRGMMGRGGPQSDPITVADTSGSVLLPGPGHASGDLLSEADLRRAAPIQVNGETVGYMLVSAQGFGPNPQETAFLAGVTRWLLLGALGTFVVALLLAGLLSRTLTQPIRELTRATHAIADGDLSVQVPVRSHDELGELAGSFNRMSAELARSLELRRQMTADIAHELRTPLSLILGHAEAVHDGVLPPSPENFEIIRDEASRLENMVEDLRTLSLADAGELTFTAERVDAGNLLHEVATMYRYRAQGQGISLEEQLQPGLPAISADPGRLTQVLTNVLDNAFRHTPAGGKIALSASASGGEVELSISDDGPGVAGEDLARLFDRFYRADPSRQRDGGSGLGLAIARSIVEMHGGQISASGAPGRGLTITIHLPASS